MKNGIAMSANESPLPNNVIMTTEKGMSRAKMNTTDVMIVAMKMGNPSRMNRMSTKNTSATCNILFHSFRGVLFEELGDIFIGDLLSDLFFPGKWVLSVDEYQEIVKEEVCAADRNRCIEPRNRYGDILKHGTCVGNRTQRSMIDDKTKGHDHDDGCTSFHQLDSFRFEEFLDQKIHTEMGILLCS